MERIPPSLFLAVLPGKPCSCQIKQDKCTEWNTDGTMFSLMEVKQSWPRNVPDLGDVASSSYLKEGRCNINNFS